MDRSSARLAVPRALGAAVLAAAVLVALPLLSAGDRPPLGRTWTAYAGTLTPFPSCGRVLQYFKDRAPDYLIARAGGVGVDAFAGAERRPPMAAEAAAGGAAAASEPPAHSTTNVQEAGVDEPDLIKTDGRRIVAVARGQVHLINLDGGRMARRTTLPDPGVRNVFLSGDRLLVFGTRPDQGFEAGPRQPGARALLALYDIADLGDPRRVASLTLDGDVLDARLVETQVRVVTMFSPDVDAPSPEFNRFGQVSAEAKAELRAAVARTTVEDWLPTYTLRDSTDAPVSRGRLVECRDLARPATFSGLDTVAVSSFDMGSALESRQTVGVVAGGQQVYATHAATYISSTEWRTDGWSAETSVHKFVTAPSGASAYRGSGAVPGTLLNSYALSEYQGVLRVASTVPARRGGWADPRSVTEGVVTTLREQDGALRRLGQVDGLGREDNESIHAVRFIEDRGYVVTFRRTDPLYVIDLRDATAPQVVGELKIPGYSGYLHPIGDDLLLGVGQSGALPGDRVEPEDNGVQFSLFDVGDPRSPRRIDTQTYGSGVAAAEFDPRAFLYWEPRDLVIAPVTLYDSPAGEQAFRGLVLLHVDAERLRELGRLATAEPDGMASRSVVIGDRVYLLSDQALSAHHLDSYTEVEKLTF